MLDGYTSVDVQVPSNFVGRTIGDVEDDFGVFVNFPRDLEITSGLIINAKGYFTNTRMLRDASERGKTYIPKHA